MNESENQAVVPYYAHEGAMARMERIHKLTVIALVIALVVSLISFVINDSLWRSHYSSLDERYQTLIEEMQNGVYQQSDSATD